MNRVGDAGEIVDPPQKVRILDDEAGGLIVDQRQQIVNIAPGQILVADDLYIHALGIGSCRLTVLGMNGRRQHDTAPTAACHTSGHDDGFRHGRGAVIVRGVAHVHAGECAYHGLVFKRGLQGALTDLWLVGRIGRIEFGTTQDVVDHTRDVAVIRAGSQETGRVLQIKVLLRYLAQLVEHLHFGEWSWQLDLGEALGRRDRCKQILDVLGTDARQHVVAFAVCVRHV